MLSDVATQGQGSSAAQDGSSSSTAPVVARQAALVVTREEAELLLEGLNMVSNCRRYAFKEPHEDIRQLHAQVFDTIEHLQRLIRENFGK